MQGFETRLGSNPSLFSARRYLNGRQVHAVVPRYATSPHASGTFRTTVGASMGKALHDSFQPSPIPELAQGDLWDFVVGAVDWLQVIRDESEAADIFRMTENNSIGLCSDRD